MNILVIAAHPDDEILGCGGAIARHAAEGDFVAVCILAEGATSRAPTRNRSAHKEELSELARAAQRAHKILGTAELRLLDLPDNRLDSMDQLDLNKIVEGLVKDLTPEVIYTHHAWDMNIDHRRIHEAVFTACRPMPKRKSPTLLSFEVNSSTEWQSPSVAPAFSPNWYVNISRHLKKKLSALDAYKSEMRPWPHARSIKAVEALARWRGATVGVEAAEAFMLGRLIKS